MRASFIVPLLVATGLAACSDDDGATTGDGGTGAIAGGGGSGAGGSGATAGGQVGGTGGSVGGAGGNAPPGYALDATADCDDGQLGADAIGPDALADTAGAGVVYSDEQALTGQSCKSFGNAGQNFFGGRFRTDGLDVGDGDDLWMRQALYFPAGFCFGYGTTSGDGWGSTKWIRIEFDNGGAMGSPGDRLTLQLGNFAPQGCNTTGTLWGATREYAGAFNFTPPTEGTIDSGAWHFIQWHVHFATDSSGFIRFWLDDEYLGQTDGITLSDPGNKIDFIIYGDYWNGSPQQDVSWYFDEVILATETPTTVDTQGNPYIAPTARIGDWEL